MDMVPGLVVEKHYLSAYDLKTHATPLHSYSPEVLMKAFLEETGLDTMLSNPLANVSESVLQLISFGADEVFREFIYVN